LESNLDVISGSWGLGWRLQGGQITNTPVDGAAICKQFDNFKNKPKYIILNLSNPADGGFWTSTHSILNTLSPNDRMTPKIDQFMYLIKGVKETCGLKVIVYVASEGPAKLLHGCKGDKKCEARATAVKAWVKNKYGNSDKDSMIKFFANDIMSEYAQKFKGLIDGYWFDHCIPSLCSTTLVNKSVKSKDPDAIIAYNIASQKAPIKIDSKYSDYTSGHPNPIGPFKNGYYNPAYACHNDPMVSPIEKGKNGYIVDKKKGKALGHMFMALQGNMWDSTSCKSVAWRDGCVMPWEKCRKATLTN